MSTSDWLTVIGSIFVPVAIALGTFARYVMGLINDTEKTLKEELAQVETRFAADRGKNDLNVMTLREEVNAEFVRRREFEISQQDKARRLEAIEKKLDKQEEKHDRHYESIIEAISKLNK